MPMKTLVAHAVVDENDWLNIHTREPADIARGVMDAVGILRRIAEPGGLGVEDPSFS